MTDDSLATLMAAIGCMADWRVVRTFTCEVVVREEHGRVETFEMHAEPMHSSYSLVNTTSGIEESYDDASRTIVTDGMQVERMPNALLTEPLPARLAFPMALPIWGRRHDLYRMTGAEREGDLATVVLEDRTDHALSGTLTVDLDRSLAVKIDAPTLGIEYRGIAPARSRFGTARA